MDLRNMFTLRTEIPIADVVFLELPGTFTVPPPHGMIINLLFFCVSCGVSHIPGRAYLKNRISFIQETCKGIIGPTPFWLPIVHHTMLKWEYNQ